MANKIEDNLDSSLQLVLSTWFIMYLRGDRPGGLPTDFLSRGSSALLVFDKVLCDKYALEAEERSSKWLSSQLFLALRDEGILKPINMHEYLPQQFFGDLQQSRESLGNKSMTERALEIMDIELSAIKKGKRKGSLRLPPYLTSLNNYMLYFGLEIPNSACYDYQEHHFKPTTSITELFQPTAIVDLDINNKICNEQGRVSRLCSALPEFSLLSRPTGDAAKALRRNIQKEKSALFRWIYGDPEMPRDRYHEYRLGTQFCLDDEKIDEPRKRQAWQKFDLLLMIRKQTRDIRNGIQKIMADVMSGRITVEDAKSDLDVYQKEFLALLHGQSSVTSHLFLAGVGTLLAVAEYFFIISGKHIPISPGFTAYEFWKAGAEWKKKRHEMKKLRQRHPFAALYQTFNKAIQTQEEKAISRRIRNRFLST